MANSFTVASRFNGPPDSGNGGYASGMVAGFLGAIAEVNLRSPVPLERPLDVVAGDDDAVRVLDGETLVAEGRARPDFELEVPAPVGVEEARAASEHYRGAQPTDCSASCFVCGRARADAFGVFAGAVEGRDLVATPWTPPEWTADESGKVKPEFVWSVLDCPTYFATYRDEELPVSFLARLTGRIDAPVAAGEEHVVIAWPIATDGRKRVAGSAVLSGAGETLAYAEGLMIEPRSG